MFQPGKNKMIFFLSYSYGIRKTSEQGTDGERGQERDFDDARMREAWDAFVLLLWVGSLSAFGGLRFKGNVLN